MSQDKRMKTTGVLPSPAPEEGLGVRAYGQAAPIFRAEGARGGRRAAALAFSIA